MEDRRDRRLDTWIETGRQFVDGVSGRRPGQRRSSFDLDSVGRWVGDKVEWLLEGTTPGGSPGRTRTARCAAVNDPSRPFPVGAVRSHLRRRFLR